MKKNLLPFLVIFMFIACKSRSASSAKDTVANNSPSKNQTEKLIKKFKPIIQGVWVETNYLNEIIKTKSPLASYFASIHKAIYINTDKITGDSLQIAVSYDDTTSNVILKFRSAKTKGTIIFDMYDLGYKVKNGDTSLILYYSGNFKDVMKIEKFTRVLNKLPNRDLDYGLGYVINKLLITGKYILSDDHGISSKVTFTNDGKVSGFYDYEHYEITRRVDDNNWHSLDKINFRGKTNHFYSFKIKADTLDLYDTYKIADTTRLVLGMLKYKLVKQK